MSDTANPQDSLDKVAGFKNFWSVRDERTPVKFVDMITECRNHNNIVYISLGSAIMDLNGAPTVDVASRLRFELGTAKSLHTMLGTMITEMARAGEKACSLSPLKCHPNLYSTDTLRGAYLMR